MDPMTKSEKIESGAPVSWQDTSATNTDQVQLAMQIMNVMEQGIIVWSQDGTCELHNTRVYEVLELERSALGIGTSRADFLAAAVARGEFSEEELSKYKRRFQAHEAFQFDRTLPSGRVIATNVRPTREGGFVVTFTDVSAARQSVAELATAKQTAEDAQSKAQEILIEERARRAEARALSDLDEWLQSCKSLDELFQIVSKFMGFLIPDSSGELYLYSNSRDVLDGACEWGGTGHLNDHIEPDACWSLRRGRAYDYSQHVLCFPCDHVSNEGELEDYICIPVIAHGDTVGLLHIKFAPKTSRSDVKSLGRFAARSAEHISMAIANVKLRDELHSQSIRDPLTNLFNRRYFLDAMRRETAAAVRGGKGYGLISFDADKFKTFNDNHGHEAGDMVLRGLAERMTSVMPDGAVCARVGGEEFAILLPKSDIDESMAQAEILRTAVEAMEVRTTFGVLPRVTISSGVACHIGDSTSPNALLKRADEALYAAKAGGRNKVEAA